jgi:hypothetical protein
VRYSLTVEGAELKRHGQAALSGSKPKAPGSAGGYLLGAAPRHRSVHEITRAQRRLYFSVRLLPSRGRDQVARKRAHGTTI